MTFNGSLLTGQVSRSAKTAAVHRLVRDGQTGIEDFTNAIIHDQELILGNQGQFSFASAGQSDWLDILRPIALSFKGFNNENAVASWPVTRWFRTNTFYRKPSIVGKIYCNGEELANALPSLSSNGIVFVPGPYTFVRLVDNSYYNNAEDLAFDYANALAKSLPALQEKNYNCVLLVEHAIGYDLSKNNFSWQVWINSAINKLKHNSILLGVHLPLADASKISHFLNNTKIDFLGIDALYTDFSSVKTEKDILLGIIDGARAHVESKEYIRKQTKLFLEKASFSGNYYIGTNDRLFDVPFDIALQKINALNQLKGELK